MEINKVRFATVGYGHMGVRHTAKLIESGLFECVGVWDINEESRENARNDGHNIYDSFEELLDDAAVKLVMVAVYNDAHKDIDCALMRAGKNVVSEYPVALNLASLTQLTEIAREKGVVFTAYPRFCSDTDYLTAKKIIEDKTLGKVFRIEMRDQSCHGMSDEWKNEEGHGGGMIFSRGIHLLDQALTFAEGDPLVSVWAKKTHVISVECEDGFYCELNFRSGLSYHLEVATNNFERLPRWYILGINGTGCVNSDFNAKTVAVSNWQELDAVPVSAGTGITRTIAPRTKDTIREESVEPVRGSSKEFIQNLYDAITSGADVLVPHRRMLRSLSVTEAVIESAEKNEVIHFNDTFAG